ncbi:MAG: protein kinase [Saprospiraceae bacterium]|nr:protein kinase [Pyrinomonadaceae bacterium]
MTCHECGSDVAEIDVFCPFCGITLEPPVKAETAADDSMERTIMIQHANLAGINKAPEPFKADDAIAPLTPLTADSAKETSGSTGTVGNLPGTADQPETVDKKESEPSLSPIGNDSDIPAPRILDDLSKTADNVAMSTSEYAFGHKENDAERIKDEVPGYIEDVPVSSDEASFDSIDGRENVVVSGIEPDEEMPVAVDDSFQALPDEISVPEDDSAESEPLVPESDEEAKVAAPIIFSGVNESLYEERFDVENSEISKPLQDLDVHDAFASNSTFDSVRIMENKPGLTQDDVDTRIAGYPNQPASQPPKADIPEKPASASTGPAIPPTAERIGVDTDGKKTNKLKALTEGTVLNTRYEIVRKVGGGGMGAVYLASDNNLGGVLRAVKEMVQAHIEDEQQEKAINDFKRESMILSTLDHAAIPTIYDYFYDEKEMRFYLVMKYISGGDLSSRLRSAPEGKIDEKCVTEWAIQIIDVLHYLHNQPTTIVYRDLKPSNIMIDGNTGRIMLIDFGIARSIHQKEEKGVTAVGTMGYAPPELFSGNVEPRSDIYSLGSTMFHLLTGADPQSNPLLIFDFQKNPRPRQINPQLSDQMERILMRAVEYNADSRFSSAAEMQSVLEEHLANIKTGNLTYGITEVPASVSLANQNVFCGFCGQRIVATDLFCAFCGAKQPIAQQGVHSEIYAQAALTAKLLIEGTSELLAPTFSLQKNETLVGRRDPMSNIFPEVDLSKYDPQTKISRRHARIWRDGNSYLVEDLGSSNGTILASGTSDSLRLPPHKPHVLASGDKIKIGDTTLFFIIG